MGSRGTATGAGGRMGAGALAVGLLSAATGGAAADERPPNAEHGAGFFERHCTSCHGVSGRGGGPVGEWLARTPPNLPSGPYRIDADGDGRPGTRHDLRRVLVDGAAPYGGSRLMAPYRQLREDPALLADLLAFLEQRPGS